jgi:predicted nucleic acid-binding protein
MAEAHPPTQLAFMNACLLDTGPLVALLDRSEPDHNRVRTLMSQFRGQRLITTGAVVTEAFYFLSDVQHGPASLVSFLDASATEVRDCFGPDALATAVRMMNKYADTPMDFPDATLVWIAEQTGTENVLTLDRRGFSSFRFARNRRFKLLLDQ